MRHDCLVKRIIGGLREKGFKVETEHLYRLHSGNVKPDIVATISDEVRGCVSVVCDVQVVSGVGTKCGTLIRSENTLTVRIKVRDPRATPFDRSSNGRRHPDMAWRLGSR